MWQQQKEFNGQQSPISYIQANVVHVYTYMKRANLNN